MSPTMAKPAVYSALVVRFSCFCRVSRRNLTGFYPSFQEPERCGSGCCSPFPHLLQRLICIKQIYDRFSPRCKLSKKRYREVRLSKVAARSRSASAIQRETRIYNFRFRPAGTLCQVRVESIVCMHRHNTSRPSPFAQTFTFKQHLEVANRSI